jgi:hypothetical protein
MKSKKNENQKRLFLNKETFVLLNTAQLNVLRGGNNPITTCGGLPITTCAGVISKDVTS